MDETFDLYSCVDWQKVAVRQAWIDYFGNRGFNPLSPASIYFKGMSDGQFRLLRYSYYLKCYCLACISFKMRIGPFPKPITLGLRPIRL